MSASKFTPEARGELVERTAAGVSLADVCRAVGVREKTVKGWITRGRQEPEGAYREFVEALEEARASAPARPGAMDAEELARVVSEQARQGSVHAMKLRWEMLRAERDRAPGARADSGGGILE